MLKFRGIAPTPPCHDAVHCWTGVCLCSSVYTRRSTLCRYGGGGKFRQEQVEEDWNEREEPVADQRRYIVTLQLLHCGGGGLA